LAAGGAAAASLLLFGVMSWPLARQVTEAIPSSAQNLEHPPWRTMIPGDHLQLLYHFDLMRAHAARADSECFQIPTNFNQGDDEAATGQSVLFCRCRGVRGSWRSGLGQAAAGT
jgi:hypothetical protein